MRRAEAGIWHKVTSGSAVKYADVCFMALHSGQLGVEQVKQAGGVGVGLDELA